MRQKYWRHVKAPTRLLVIDTHHQNKAHHILIGNWKFGKKRENWIDLFSSTQFFHLFGLANKRTKYVEIFYLFSRQKSIKCNIGWFWLGISIPGIRNIWFVFVSSIEICINSSLKITNSKYKNQSDSKPNINLQYKTIYPNESFFIKNPSNFLKSPSLCHYPPIVSKSPSEKEFIHQVWEII